MRGLAKIRELDLRLARTTEKARNLRLMAREAAEQAKLVASVATGAEVKTSTAGPVLFVERVERKHVLRS